MPANVSAGCESKGLRIIEWNLFRSFDDAMDRAKVENFRFHDLRHTFATRLVQAGVGMYEVQKLGRWKTPSMVMRYAHHNPESLRPAIEIMDGFSQNFITVPKKRGYKPVLRLVTS